MRNNLGKVVLPIILVIAMTKFVADSMAVDDRSATAADIFYNSYTSYQLAQIYDKIEQTLLMRLESSSASTNLNETILAIGNIRSRKAIPKLLKILEYTTAVRVLPDGYLVFLSRGTYNNTYPALGALVQIGVPLDECLAELEKAEQGTDRAHLLIILGLQLHGRAFELEIQRRAASSAEKEKWEQLLRIMPPNKQEP